jgi:transcriptional regulator with XRE-family HTH domain
MNQLRRYLARHDETQTDLARQLNVWPSTISSWLSGRRSPSRDLAVALEKLTNGEVPADGW